VDIPDPEAEVSSPAESCFAMIPLVMLRRLGTAKLTCISKPDLKRRDICVFSRAVVMILKKLPKIFGEKLMAQNIWRKTWHILLKLQQ
jgi:hypothetical protein